MKISVVTSFNREGYEDYGRRCIESLHQFWPTEVALYVISEDIIDLPPHIKDTRKFYYLNLYHSSTAAHDFHIMHVGDPKAHGRDRLAAKARYNRHWKTGYNFRKDAYKFSKKVFAIDVAAKHAGSGLLIWLDADTLTFKDIPISFLQDFMPNNFDLACLERRGYHSECGFVIYNLNRPTTKNFISKFVNLYYTGDVFTLPEWHDSWVFDWLRKKLLVSTFSIPHTDMAHPFNYSKLGEYMDHMKGDRKYTGVKMEDVIVRRPVRRWNKPKRFLPKRT